MPAYASTHHCSTSGDAAVVLEMDTMETPTASSSNNIALAGNDQEQRKQQHQQNQASWNMRDMAREIISNRIVEYSSMSQQLQLQQRPMPASSQFNFDLAMARIRRDKAAVVRHAFEAAATAVLEVLAKDGGNGNVNNRRNKMSSNNNEISINEDELPSILKDTAMLGELRDASMDRAHDNKEYSKRKPGGITSRQGTTGTLGGGSSAGEGDASNLAGGGGVGGPNSANQKGGTSTSGKSKKATDSKTKSDTPKFTRNTPASSAVSEKRKTMQALFYLSLFVSSAVHLNKS